MGQPTTNGINVQADAGVGNSSVSSSPGAVLFDTPYAFVLGADGHLHVCYWSGDHLGWLWDDITFLESQL
jgi:hypothetical protein